jgi:hypothetical protein
MFPTKKTEAKDLCAMHTKMKIFLPFFHSVGHTGNIEKKYAALFRTLASLHGSHRCSNRYANIAIELLDADLSFILIFK